MMSMTAVCIDNYQHDWSEKFMRLLSPKGNNVYRSRCHDACFLSKLPIL